MHALGAPSTPPTAVASGARAARYLLVLCSLVFCVVFCEFRLVHLTSSLTVSVFGVLKEILTVLIAFLAGDRFSALNAVGLVLCVCGNVVYFWKRAGPPAAQRRARAAHLRRTPSERERYEAEKRPVILDAEGVVDTDSDDLTSPRSDRSDSPVGAEGPLRPSLPRLAGGRA